jgi:C1A family cysteine protease
MRAETLFSYYKSGIYKCSSTVYLSNINHEIQIIGYNDTAKYYIIKNSWSTGWGMRGFGYIDFTMDCGLKINVNQLTQ